VEPVLITALASVLVGVVGKFLAHFVKNTVSRYVKRSDVEKITVTSSSGQSVNVEVKKDMSEEERVMFESWV
jgi:hypothetical protein